MKNLLEYILTHLLAHPEDLQIDETNNDYGDLVLLIKAHSEDIPRIIGRNGSMIKALRRIMQSLAANSNQRVNLQIEE